MQAHQYQFSWSGLMDPYLNSLEPLGISCFVVCVMQCGRVGLGGLGLVKVCIVHKQKMHLYLIH